MFTARQSSPVSRPIISRWRSLCAIVVLAMLASCMLGTRTAHADSTVDVPFVVTFTSGVNAGQTFTFQTHLVYTNAAGGGSTINGTVQVVGNAACSGIVSGTQSSTGQLNLTFTFGSSCAGGAVSMLSGTVMKLTGSSSGTFNNTSGFPDSGTYTVAAGLPTDTITSATPELGSGELLATGILPVGVVLLYRRRRARRATQQQP